MQSTVKLAPDQAEAAEAVRASTFAEAFQATAARFADEVALRTPDGSVEVTFAEYAERVRGIAAGLSALGLKRGDTIALLTVNRPEFFICDTAALHVGATPFSVYATSSPEQIAYLFENAGNEIVITERVFLPQIQAALAAMDGAGPAQVICIDGAEDGTIELAALESSPSPAFDFDASWRAISPR